MAKDTVRYPDEVVAAIDEQVADGVFESKSEFYRFAAEYVLSQVSEEYEPETFAFEELLDELPVATGTAGAGADADVEAVGVVVRAVEEGRGEALVGRLDARGLHMTGAVRVRAVELIGDAASRSSERDERRTDSSSRRRGGTQRFSVSA